MIGQGGPGAPSLQFSAMAPLNRRTEMPQPAQGAMLTRPAALKLAQRKSSAENDAQVYSIYAHKANGHNTTIREMSVSDGNVTSESELDMDAIIP